MRKKESNEQVKIFIDAIVKDIQYDMNFDIYVTEKNMNRAEMALFDSLDYNQRLLFAEYSQRKAEFFNIASQIYKRKFD